MIGRDHSPKRSFTLSGTADANKDLNLELAKEDMGVSHAVVRWVVAGPSLDDDHQPTLARVGKDAALVNGAIAANN